MTTLTTTAIPAREGRTALPTVSIAGVDWPVYKLRAVAIGVLLALCIGIPTGSAQVAAWALVLGTTGAWWARHGGPAATR